MKNKSHILYLNIAVLLFGFAGLFAKWIHIPSLGITFGRVFFSSITLFIYLKVTKADIHIQNRKDFAMMLVSGAILAVHWWAFLASIQYSTVAIGTITTSSFPLFLTFLEPLAFKEKLETKRVVAAVFMLIGVLLTLPSLSFENTMLKGALLGILASFAYAIMCLLNRYFSRNYSGTVISFYEQAVAALVLLPFVLTSGIRPSGMDVALLLFLGIFTTALAHTLYISCLKKIPAQVAGVCSSMENVYSIGMAYLFLKEVPSVKSLFGAAIIILTSFLSQMSVGEKAES